VWRFVSPRIILFGEDALEHLEEIEGSRALIIAGKTVVGLGIADIVADRIKETGWEVKILDFVEPDPSFKTVQRAARIADDFKPDLIIGLGGGSSMDAAKAIWALYENPGLDVQAISPMEPLTVGRKSGLLCIPTTSGSGSEATWAIVLTDTGMKLKREMASIELVPPLVIADPSLTVSMSPDLTAWTGMDALTHAIEAYVSTWRNDFSDALATGALRLIFEYLPRAVEDGQDIDAREHVQNASTMAGMAFSNSGIGIAHAMAHAVGALFKIHHGLAVAISLLPVIEFNAEKVAPRYARIARTLGMNFETDEEGTALLTRALRKLMERMGMSCRLCDAGIDQAKYESALDELVERAMLSTANLCNPREAGSSDYRQLFLKAYGPL